MKRSLTAALLALALAMTPLPAAAESLEEVLAGFYEAIGGLDTWKAAKSVRWNGRMQLPTGDEAPFVMTFERPMKARMEVTLQGMKTVQVFDGETAWAIMPFTGSSEPMLMPDEPAALMKEQSDLDGPLVDWESKGYKVELVGEATVDDRPAHHIRVTLDTEEVRDLFLDRESHLLVRQEVTAMIQGEELPIETNFKDYKEVGGLMISHSIESRPQGAPSGQLLTIDKAEIDVEIEEGFFTMNESSDEVSEDEAAQ